MALLLARDAGDFEPLHVVGLRSRRCRGSGARSGIGGRVASGQSVRLDDPLAVDALHRRRSRVLARRGDLLLRAVRLERAADRRVRARPPRERRAADQRGLGLLTAVAGQAAIAIENGRLYRQLHLKASELDRLRAFNENILESLDDGLMVLGLDGRVIRWNQALERCTASTRADALGQPLDRLFDPSFVGACCARQRRERPQGATLFRVPLTGRGTHGDAACWSTSRRCRCRRWSARRGSSGTIVILEDITERAQLEEQLRISEKMASLGLLAAGVAHEVNTPLTGISSYTQMLLEQADPEDPRTAVLEKIEKQTFRAARIVNGLLHLSRPNAAERPSAPGRSQRRHRRRAVAARASAREGQRQDPPRAGGRRSAGRGLRVQAAAGVPQPVPQRARRDAERRLADDRHARRRATRSWPRCPTPAPASRPSTSRASTIRSSRRRPSDRAPASACRSPTASCASTTASIQCQSAPGQGTRFTLRFKLAQPTRNWQRVGVPTVGAGAHRYAAEWFSPRHRRRRDHARDPRDPARARGLRGAPRRVTAAKGSTSRARCRSTRSSST